MYILICNYKYIYNKQDCSSCDCSTGRSIEPGKEIKCEFYYEMINDD